MLAVLRSGMLVQGPRVAAFEALVAQRAGRAHGVAVSSGTAALQLALEVVGVGPGDEVLCPALTWPSPAHAAVRLGAKVVLVDVESATWNARPDAFAAVRTAKTKAAIVIDQFGNPSACELKSLTGLAIVEDAACAIGAMLSSGEPCGSLGAVGCFSFHPRKVLTTGEGGVCVTDDEALAARLRILRNHGQGDPGQFVEAAGNFRLGEMAGAMGEVQMSRLDDALARRRAHAEAIRDALGGQLQFQATPEGARHSFQTLGALLPERVDKASLIAGARERGVQVGALSYSLDSIGTLEGDTPVARDIASRGVALPLYPQMSVEERETVIEVLGEMLGGES